MRQQSMPSSGTRFQLARCRATTTLNQVRTATAAGAAVASALKAALEAEHEEDCYATEWLPWEEDQPVPA